MKKLLILPFLIFLGCADEEQQQPLDPEIIAEAEIYTISQVAYAEYEVKEESVGKATFYQTGEVVTIEIELENMPPNTAKAVHIHDGTLEVPGRHWNAGKFIAACSDKSLGKAWDKLFVGDIGNVPIGANGKGTFSLQTDLWKINSGDERDILDKVLIIHEDPEDFAVECEPGHSHDYLHTNVKIGGGKIKLVSDIPQNEQATVTTEQVMPDFLICR